MKWLPWQRWRSVLPGRWRTSAGDREYRIFVPPVSVRAAPPAPRETAIASTARRRVRQIACDAEHAARPPGGLRDRLRCTATPPPDGTGLGDGMVAADAAPAAISPITAHGPQDFRLSPLDGSKSCLDETSLVGLNPLCMDRNAYRRSVAGGCCRRSRADWIDLRPSNGVFASRPIRAIYFYWRQPGRRSRRCSMM